MRETSFDQEGIKIPIQIRSFDEMHGITMCCVVMNEEKEIKEFLQYHRPYFKNILMIDGGSKDRTIEIATPLVDGVYMKRFDGHYSNQANRLFENVRTDWIFLIDTDERIEKKILEDLPNIINQEEYDCFSLPRKNYIDGKLHEEHYPDYQERIFRSYCRRVRPVHGEVVGYKRKKELPCIDGNFIIHSKRSQRHVIRNKGYLAFELMFKHEMGKPGCQTKDNYEKEYPSLSERNFTVNKA